MTHATAFKVRWTNSPDHRSVDQRRSPPILSPVESTDTEQTDSGSSYRLLRSLPHPLNKSQATTKADTVSLCRPGCLRLWILMPQSPQCWDCRHVVSHVARKQEVNRITAQHGQCSILLHLCLSQLSEASWASQPTSFCPQHLANFPLALSTMASGLLPGFTFCPPTG